MTAKTIITIFIAVALLAGIAYVALYQEPDDNMPAGETFVADGNVTRDNPGQSPGVWYLVYERPGSPARSAELRFESIKLPALNQGQRVHVEGFLQGDAVSVQSIQILK